MRKKGCGGASHPRTPFFALLPVCVRILPVNGPGLVLASNSPRRRELLALGGWPFQVRPADVDESRLPGETPAGYVLRLAETKARTCAAEAMPDQVILGADTCVVNGPDILGKPGDPAEAVEMLRSLRGHPHQVLSGIAVLRTSDGALVTDLCTTQVPMRAYGEDEIAAYVASGDPLDKAGAYAIQHPGFHPVEALHGCYASVMGLPLCHLARSLRKLGLPPGPHIARECQSALKYACPVSSAILRGETAG
jgi:septum formation protein